MFQTIQDLRLSDKVNIPATTNDDLILSDVKTKDKYIISVKDGILSQKGYLKTTATTPVEDSVITSTSKVGMRFRPWSFDNLSAQAQCSTYSLRSISFTSRDDANTTGSSTPVWLHIFSSEDDGDRTANTRIAVSKNSCVINESNKEYVFEFDDVWLRSENNAITNPDINCSYQLMFQDKGDETGNLVNVQLKCTDNTNGKVVSTSNYIKTSWNKQTTNPLGNYIFQINYIEFVDTLAYGITLGANATGGPYTVTVGALAGTRFGTEPNTASLAVQVGSFATSEVNGTAVGAIACSGGGGVAVGCNANACSEAVAIGASTGAKANGVSVGWSATAEINAVAVGSEACANSQATAIGQYARANEMQAVALGASADADKQSVAIGTMSGANANSVVVGYRASANVNSVVVGYRASASCSGSIAIGYYAKANSTDSVAFANGSENICMTWENFKTMLSAYGGVITPIQESKSQNQG